MDFSVIMISIHTPRVGRDTDYFIVFNNFYISIHTPRVGRDLKRRVY